ncbi:hypothetical protein DBV05_g8246 [Lasiodiplodia theobromae]|uniref:Uncharacterized protein n=1 Tax=Lasiodiplodia theobromae TaxID=45133 RepID=A0A5N5D6R9_9PEZI|nr:hypothetical protein DBV05_g8246 [Lasiodiplodia theobromae]
MASTPASDETPHKRTILFLNFSEDTIEDIEKFELLKYLKSRARVLCATNPATAYAHLGAAVKPSAILIADAALTNHFALKEQREAGVYGSYRPPKTKEEEMKQYGAFLAYLNTYVRSGGGTVVFCKKFSGDSSLPHMEDVFSTAFGLPWKAFCYHRSTFMLRVENMRRLSLTADLAPQYSVKAVHLMDVEEKDRLYVPRSDSYIESFVFAPEPVDQNETPVAWADVGEGMVGYIGDVNSEEGSKRVLLAMCGL